MQKLHITRRNLILLLVAVALMFLIVSMGGTVWFQPHFAVQWLARQNPDVLFEVDTERKVVALTIDDAPHPDITPGVLDLLLERDLHLTWFVLGDNIAGNEAIIERMRGEGHEIGNHLVEDRPSILLPKGEFERQLLEMDPWIDRDAEYRWLRPGSGWFSPAMVRLARKHGYRIVLGSIFPHDDTIRDPQTLYEWVMYRVQPGAIIILHDGDLKRKRLGETLALVLDGLADEGYEVVTVSELVGMTD